MSQAQYTGHGANTGGLQAHSCGPMMPYTVIRVGDYWHAMDTRTANTGARRMTYQEAEMDVHSLRLRNMMHG